MDVKIEDIIYDMPEEQYHAETGLEEGQWISRSMIHCYRQSPFLFFQRYVNKHPAAQFNGNKATRFGRLLEAYFFDPLSFVGKPDGYDGRKNEWKNWKKEQQDQGRTIVDMSEHDKCDLMYMSLYSTKSGAAFWDGLLTQPVVRAWVNDMPVQIRIDAVSKGIRLWDLKTTSSRLDKFNTSAFKYGYDLQDVIYTLIGNEPFDIDPEEKMGFVVCQTCEPYGCEFIHLPEEMRINAKILFEECLEGIFEGVWHTESSTRTTFIEYPAADWMLEG